MPRERDDVGTYEDILGAARRTTGLDDLGGTEHEEGLRVLLDDLASPEAGLTGVGRYFQRAEVKSALVGRLLTQAAFERHPEHADVDIHRPVFVLGLPRSGTTALHRLLHADPRHQGLEVWLTQYPQPRPSRETWAADPIFAAMQDGFTAHHTANPEFTGLHYMDATTVEECWRLLRQVGKSNSYETLAHVPRYAAWLRTQDWTDAYAAHRRNLQLIGLNDRDQRWVLKNPSHLSALDALMAVYPDALVVNAFRDPATAMTSFCSLSATTTAGHSTTFVGETIGRTQLDLWSHAFHDFWAKRADYDPAQFVDVDYDDFVADPVATVLGIYAAFDLGVTPEARAAIEAEYHDSVEGPRKPSHRYAIDDYGLTADQVRAAFDRG